MENVEIARILKKYADLLEVQQSDRFRVNSYRRAAETIESLSQPLAQLVARGEDITRLPAIGKSMAEHVREILKTATLGVLQELRKEFPESFDAILRIEGLGPKRAKLLYDQLSIRSVGELREALDSGKVATLPGFGRRSAEKLRQALSRIEARPERLRLFDAEQLVRPLIEHLTNPPDIERLEVAGSYRRRMETVGDVDILAICSKPRPVMDRFRSYPEVERVLGAGSTRGTVILRSGLQVDLRIVPRESYGAALCYFTGSKAHNVALRKRGVERGLRINEYGIFEVDSRAAATEETEGKRIAGAEEKDVYAAVGLDFVPPELRENRGEIEAAAKHKLPHLIALDDLRGDLQMHSDWTDGHNTIEEMLVACKERGYQYCAITDHSQAVHVAGGLNPSSLRKQLKEVEKVRSRFRGITLLAGCEVDILSDGSLDLPDDILDQLDLVVAAVHSKMDMPAREMTQRVLKAIAHPAVTILAHPTGRQIGQRDPMAIDLEKVFQAAKKHDVALELNSQPSRLDLNDVHVLRAGEVGVKLAINTDAHSIEQLRFMSYGIDQARRGWLGKKQVINTLAWPQFHKWLTQRKRKHATPAAR